MLLCSLSAMGQKNEPKMQRIYMFGFAASFTDSVAYQTDIQQIDSAWLDKHKMLVDRSLYSLQLQWFLESAKHKKNTTCTVFFATKPNKLERRWKKVQKRFQNIEGLHLHKLERDEFAFKAEEYRPIIMEEDTATTAPISPVVPKASPSAGK